jgi:serine-type D-Ala-D-Ala carboxypeptidase
MQLDQTRLEHTIKLTQEAIEYGGYHSLVLAVANQTDVLYRAVVPGVDPVSWESIFGIASISKPITASVMMQLVEQGKLVLSDPIADYIPQFAQNGKEGVTIWHLITHTSGLDEPQGEAFDTLLINRTSADEYINLACQSGLRFEPGTQWSYAWLSYNVLAEIITRVSGQSHHETMRQLLFEPLGMVDTAFSPRDATRLVPFPIEQRPPEYRDYMDGIGFPAFGLYSTADDLIAFGRAFLGEGKYRERQVLSRGAVETMTRLHTDGIMAIENGKPRPTYSGLGWGVRSPFGNVLASERAYGHAGAGGNWLWIDPEYDLIFVLLSNSANPKPNLPIRLLNTIYGALERS